MAEPYNTNERQAFSPVESIPLAEAVLCADCECITRAKNGHCPVCESKSLIRVQRLLDGETVHLI